MSIDFAGYRADTYWIVFTIIPLMQLSKADLGIFLGYEEIEEKDRIKNK